MRVCANKRNKQHIKQKQQNKTRTKKQQQNGNIQLEQQMQHKHKNKNTKPKKRKPTCPKICATYWTTTHDKQWQQMYEPKQTKKQKQKKNQYKTESKLEQQQAADTDKIAGGQLWKSKTKKHVFNKWLANRQLESTHMINTRKWKHMTKHGNYSKQSKYAQQSGQNIDNIWEAQLWKQTQTNMKHKTHKKKHEFETHQKTKGNTSAK